MTELSYVERVETMQDLMEEIQNLHRDNNLCEDTVDRAKSIVEESQIIIKNSSGLKSSEMVIDGKILSVGGRINKLHIHSFDTNLKSFDPSEYNSGVVAFLEKSDYGRRNSWEILSSDTYGMFKKAPPLNYKLGTFKLDPPPPPEKEKSQRHRKVPDATKKTVSAVDKTEETEKDDVAAACHHILKCLIQNYKRNQKQPLNFFKFIIDPNDFWKTVQNIFHFSFLVRDAKVKMILDEERIPVIAPLKQGELNEDQEEARNVQFNFNISPVEWKKLITAFEVTSASIS